MTVFTISATEVAVAAMLLVTVICLALCAYILYRARRACPHTSGVRETRACDAICCSCGKNLGFIGKYRS